MFSIPLITPVTSVAIPETSAPLLLLASQARHDAWSAVRNTPIGFDFIGFKPLG
jgi:hypothetical protein